MNNLVNYVRSGGWGEGGGWPKATGPESVPAMLFALNLNVFFTKKLIDE